MVATLQSRREALESKIKEKNEELKKLCMEEAELTGVIPPEIPLEPGEPPPQLRRRVGTSFSFPQNLINQIKNADDESLTALEVECEVQTNIAEAALTLANDSTSSKHVRRKYRLMYRQSQRKLMELETRLALLKQSKSQNIKQQAKKKPRPVSSEPTGSDSCDQLRARGQMSESWADEIDHIDNSTLHRFGSLQRSRRSSATSKSSGSQMERDMDDVRQNNYLYQSMALSQLALLPSFSQPNIQGLHTDESRQPTHHHHPNARPARRGTVAVAWDCVSAGGGTLLPNQTYPDHSHHPNLNRTQSLGSVETKDSWSLGEPKKEKEWYETSLDSAPSPPIRTSSRLPPAMRILQNLKEAHSKDNTYNPGMKTHLPYPTTSSHPRPLTYDSASMKENLEVGGMRERSRSVYMEPRSSFKDHDFIATAYEQELLKLVKTPQVLHHLELSSNNIPTKRNWVPQERTRSDSVVINIPEEVTEFIDKEKTVEVESTTPPPPLPSKLPTQAYYHHTPTRTHQTTIPSEGRTLSSPELTNQSESNTFPNIHPPHAVTQNELHFDTVVPFESPQNHTVIQAGKWQPYREVTKPFEMSDFYKYSTKFRRSRTPVPEANHQKVVYQPLQPMTCQPLERNSPGERHIREDREISKPEIV